MIDVRRASGWAPAAWTLFFGFLLCPAGAAPAAAPVPRFAHVVVIVFENKEASGLSAPTFNHWAGATLG